MDLHPYDIVCHDTTRHDSCHVHMHGFIHDSWLPTCQSCLLRLMYILRLLYVIKCFRVSVCWRLYKRSSSSLFLLVF
jgi:hypothetical protein